MIASKNQITRQKNVIDMGPTATMAVESVSTKATDDLEISHNLNKLTLDERNNRGGVVSGGGGVVPLDCCLNEIELINESLNKLTNRLLTDPNVDEQRQIELNEGAFSFNSSSIAILESSPPLSSCSSSSSPSNLLNPNTADRLAKSNKSLNSTATSSSSMSVSPSLPSTTTVSAKIATKEKVNKVKANKPNKYLVSTNSVPLVQPKPKRLANLIRLSNATFFSKSCPGEEMTEFVASNESTSPESKTKSLQNDINTGTKPSKSPPPAAETTPQAPASVNHHHHHQKITGKSLFSFATRTNKPPKKSTESNASSPLTSSSTSMNSPLPAHLLDDTGNSSTGGSTTLISYSGTINGYNVDVEKLARELILPSMNEPLTSYKTPMKPPLVTSKTIDATQSKKRSTFMRSLTQHK